MKKILATTILGVRRGNEVSMAGDGQVTFGETVMKRSSVKVRKIFDDSILVGFAGSAADAFTLFEKFEKKLEQYRGNLYRAAVELAKEWRTDKFLRKLEALLGVMDKEKSLVISGSGDVIEPDDGIIAIGSGGNYALAAARALLNHTELSPKEIVKVSLEITDSICIYTNSNVTILDLDSKKG